MLGKTISDPEGIEGGAGTVEGLGLLDVETVLEREKVTRSVTGVHVPSATRVSGYEIHVGRTTGSDVERAALELRERETSRFDGAVSPSGKVWGTYVHGIFASNEFRQHVLVDFFVSSTHDHDGAVEMALNCWADQLEHELDLDGLLRVANSRE